MINTLTTALYKVDEAIFPVSDFRTEKTVDNFGKSDIKGVQNYSIKVISKKKSNISTDKIEPPISLSSAFTKQYIKNIYEVFPIIERYENKTEFQRAFSENVSTNEMPSWGIKHEFYDTLGVSSHKEPFRVYLNKLEAIHLNESRAVNRKFIRMFNEGIKVSSKRVSYPHKYINESFIAIKDNRIRENAAIVLSNISISEGGITLQQFREKADTVVGYYPFIEFKVGDYEYQKAIYKLVAKKKTTDTNPAIYNYCVHIDIPDTFDRGTAKIKAEQTKVYLNKFYYNPPDVNVSVVSGVGIVIPTIIDVTGEDSKGRYFTVELRNTSNQLVSGVISWAARGY